MVDVQTRPPERPDRDGARRGAALWATVIALPVAVLVGVVFFLVSRPKAAAEPAAAPSTPVAVPSTPVLMTAPKLSAHDAQVCLAVTSQLPTAVRNLPARKVSAGPEQNAAYGAPPLTLACGVAMPTMCTTITGGRGCVPLDADLLIMNRVCWYGAPGTGGTVFVTMDREVAVQVTVPTGFQNPAQWANEFSDKIVETVKSRTTGVPTGCSG
jgi:hypothetical protein